MKLDQVPRYIREPHYTHNPRRAATHSNDNRLVVPLLESKKPNDELATFTLPRSTIVETYS